MRVRFSHLSGHGRDGERSRPIFETFCSDIEHMGAVGHGQVAKMMNNYLLWVNGCALIGAGRLAESTGIDLPKLRKALMMSSGDSAALRDWDRMTFTWALKDMQMMEKLMDKENQSSPLASLIKELVKDGRSIKASNPPDWSGEGHRETRTELQTCARDLHDNDFNPVSGIFLLEISLETKARSPTDKGHLNCTKHFMK